MLIARDTWFSPSIERNWRQERHQGLIGPVHLSGPRVGSAGLRWGVIGRSSWRDHGPLGHRYFHSGNPAVVGNSRRPVALRPRLSAGLPLSAGGRIAQGVGVCQRTSSHTGYLCKTSRYRLNIVSRSERSNAAQEPLILNVIVVSGSHLPAFVFDIMSLLLKQPGATSVDDEEAPHQLPEVGRSPLKPGQPSSEKPPSPLQLWSANACRMSNAGPSSDLANRRSPTDKVEKGIVNGRHPLD